MSEPTSAEFTTRDVLLQIDRRLELSEGDVRRLDSKIDEFESRLTARIDGGDNKLAARIDGLEARLDLKIELLRKEMNTRFYWLVGLMFVTWISTMGTILVRT
jgi:hypothetical protein